MPRTLIVAVTAALLAVPSVPATAAAGATDTRVSYRQWGTAKQLATGKAMGTQVVDGRLLIAAPVGRARLGDTTYDWARWRSPYVDAGFDLTELVPSWSARTPGNTWVRVDVRGVTASGASTGWDKVARWAAGDRFVRRTSFGRQPDGGARMSTDTWVAPSGVRRWQLRVTLFRKAGTTLTPAVDTVGAMVSRDATAARPTSRPLGLATGTVLPVPAYSQMTHEGDYPQYDGGGEAWCSPTSTSMVLGYYGRLPSARAYAWVKPSHADRFVDHAARMTYDYAFEGTGNWPFNTAYAAGRTGRSFVTRLHDLRDAERFIAAGIPLVASISFGRGQLAGAPISSTSGHLLVIVGFTAGGDVVVNDPAAARNSAVRRTYDRAQLEAAWLRRSGGLVYVIADSAHPLPARAGSTSW